MIIKEMLYPLLLKDKSRLQEIYNLRVMAWENSAKNEFVNKEYFPNGWSDSLDKEAKHWIVEDNDKIIASARVCIVNSLDEIEEDFSKFQLPKERPFAFFSRLVIHPDYRRRGLTMLMDKVRLDYLTQVAS